MKRRVALCSGIVFAAVLIQTPLPWADSTVPPRAAAVLRTAQGMMEEGRIDDAIDALRKFRRGRSVGHDHFRIDFALGNCFLIVGKPAEAEQYYRSTLAKYPDHASSWSNLARSLYELGNYVAAGEAFLNTHDRRADKRPEDLYHAAQCFIAGEAYSEALKSLERLSADHPAAVQPAWKEALVHVYMTLAEHEKALPHIRDLATTSPADRRTQWRELLIHQYVALGLTTEALDCLTEWTRSEPAEPRWWKALVHLHLGGARLEEALTALTIYGYLVPLAEREIRLAADIALALEIPVKAVQLYEAGFEETADPEIIRRLVHAFIRLHRHEDALRIIQAAPDDSGLIELKAYLHHAVGGGTSSSPDRQRYSY